MGDDLELVRIHRHHALDMRIHRVEEEPRIAGHLDGDLVRGSQLRAELR